MKKAIQIAVLALMPVIAAAQPAYQSAWRAYNEYATSVQNKEPDMDYLNKAKTKIDELMTTPDGEKVKCQALNVKIYYALFQANLSAEKKKLEPTVSNVSERAELAYGNVSTKELEVAGKSLEKVAAIEGNATEKPNLMELGMVTLAMMNDIQNLAIGRFKVKKYDEAMELFLDSYSAYKMMGKKDTSAVFNALLAAELAKKNDKVLEFSKLMIDDKVANAETYSKMHFAHLNMKDTVTAEGDLKSGLALYPNDKSLILNYINICLQTRKEAQAMEYIDKAIAKDPKNPALFLVLGNIYDGQANPKTADNKDAPKPENFEELIKKAESNYLKAVALDTLAYEPNFNLGAVYNNWGNWYSAKSTPQNAAEMDAKAKDNWLKAIKYLEKALAVRKCEKPLMFNIARLYRFTEQQDKAKAMNDRYKAPCDAGK